MKLHSFGAKKFFELYLKIFRPAKYPANMVDRLGFREFLDRFLDCRIPPLRIFSIRKIATNYFLYHRTITVTFFVDSTLVQNFHCPTVVRIAYNYRAVYRSSSRVTIPFKNEALRDECISKRSTFDPPSIGAPSTFPIVFTSCVPKCMKIVSLETRLKSANVHSCISFHFVFRLIFVRYRFRSTSEYVFKILSRFEFLKATIERSSRRQNPLRKLI